MNLGGNITKTQFNLIGPRSRYQSYNWTRSGPSLANWPNPTTAQHPLKVIFSYTQSTMRLTVLAFQESGYKGIYVYELTYSICMCMNRHTLTGIKSSNSYNEKLEHTLYYYYVIAAFSPVELFHPPITNQRSIES